MSIEIKAADVIRMIEQFLKENSLTRTLSTLQEESLVRLGAVDSLDQFVGDIEKGNWDMTLGIVSSLKLPDEHLTDLYEQIFYELVEVRELGVARHFLRQSSPLSHIKESDVNRYLKLERVLAAPSFDAKEIYGTHGGKEERRSEIACRLSRLIEPAQPSRLLFLLGQAIQWQKHMGYIPSHHSQAIDLFKDTQGAHSASSSPDAIVSLCYCTMNFEREFHLESAAFSSDGKCFVAGTADGFIELWTHKQDKRPAAWPFEHEEGSNMVMEGAVFCLGFNKSNTLLVSGAQSGDITVWSMADRSCAKRFSGAHGHGVSSVQFLKDESQILSTGYDKLIKIFGLKSGQMIKEFKGHAAFVHSATLTSDAARLISCCSDGTLKIWDMKTTDCVMTISPRQDVDQMGSSVINLPIYSVIKIPKKEEYVICCKAPLAPVISSHGITLHVLKSDSSSDFVAGVISPHGKYYYSAAEDGHLYCFDLDKGTLVRRCKVADEEVIGLCHDPASSTLAIYTADGLLKLWRPA